MKDLFAVIVALASALDAMAQRCGEPVALERLYETIIQWDEGGGKRSRRELSRRIAALYAAPSPAILQELARLIHYPEHWDTAAYPSILDAIRECLSCAGCSECAALPAKKEE